jgi:hypothetical protein
MATPWSRILLEKRIVRSVSQENHRLVWNMEFRYRVHNIPLPFPVQRQIDPMHTVHPYLLEVHFKISHTSMPVPLSDYFPQAS